MWRFPYIVGENGGAAFVIVYLAFLAVLGFPLLAVELGIGRAANKSLAAALGALAPPRLGGKKKMGVFATRSPFRPNPIGLSCVRLVGVEHTAECMNSLLR